MVFNINRDELATSYSRNLIAEKIQTNVFLFACYINKVKSDVN